MFRAFVITKRQMPITEGIVGSDSAKAPQVFVRRDERGFPAIVCFDSEDIADAYCDYLNVRAAGITHSVRWQVLDEERRHIWMD